MKVLLFSPVPPPMGGIASWTKILLNNVDTKEHQITLVNTAFIGKAVKDFHKFHFFSELKRNLLIVLKSFQVNSVKPDIVHINTPCHVLGMFREYLCCLITKKKTNKLVVHIRCDASYMVKSSIALFIFKKMIKKADIVIALNKNTELFVNKHTGKQSYYLPNFLDLNKEKNNKVINQSLNSLIYVGHVSHSKGIFDLNEIAKKHPELTFDIVGFCTMDTSKFEKNIHFHGQLDKYQVFEKMFNADALLFPSHSEGFSNAIAEAMALGLPIIASDVGAASLMLDNPAMLFNVGDITQASKIINSLKSAENRQKESTLNYNKSKDFIVDKVIHDLFELYKK